jgi:hypothetical protein
MALGQRDSAEAVLRSVVSYGFALVDNGTSAIEELIGTSIVGTGRDALRRFYVIEHDPRAGSPGLESPRRSAASESADAGPTSAVDAQRWLLTWIEDPRALLGKRFEGLRVLSASSCTSVRGLMLGPGAEVNGVIGRARHTLARFPSEQALVDLDARLPTWRDEARSSNPLQSLAVSSASVAGAVLRNPRLASCTRLFTAGW